MGNGGINASHSQDGKGNVNEPRCVQNNPQEIAQRCLFFIKNRPGGLPQRKDTLRT